MSETVIVAIISLIGTLLGGLFGVLASQRLTEHRLKQLEAKQDKHNEVIERTYKLEGAVIELQHDVKELKTKIS